MYAIFARETLALFQGNEGKLAAQAGHAYLHAYWDAEELCDLNVDYALTVSEYRGGNDARKIALVVDTLDELNMLFDHFLGEVGATIVEDCGYTIFTEPTITCLGIGPVRDEDKGPLASLKLLRHELAESELRQLAKDSVGG